MLLYEALGRLAPSPIVDLNRAVAVSMADGPEAALPIVDDLAAPTRCRLAPAPDRPRRTARRMGRPDEARVEFERAIELCGNARERAVLERKIADLG